MLHLPLHSRCTQLGGPMQIRLNGEERCLPDAATVADLLALLELEPPGIAVECNAAVVPGAQFAETVLREGDVVEVVRFVGGG